MAADGTIKILVELSKEEAEKALSGFGKLSEKAFSGLAGAAKIGAEAVAIVSAGLTAAGGAAIRTGADFEAGMSRVQAISGAVGKEFEDLKNLAIQLGAETAFSAGEAAAGMENLASAGFEVEEIIAAMPGMLDLAASSGEDLAVASDIAASTLRAFGMEAGEAARVADVLAQNAAATNAGVYDTGEAMKYVAPMASSMGLKFEECAAAIGILANNGIQGSQAGTTLRGALSRLAKPTKEMKMVMEELGFSAYDSSGKMLSLGEQVAVLEESMQGLTNEQRDQYLVTLYGQEALSGMTALISTGSMELKDLTTSYEDCKGAAQAMADTMQDNLQAKTEQFQGSLESLGISIYYEMEEPMKKAAEAATSAVEGIQEALSSGGLQGAVEAAGDVFADLATQAAKQAPAMVRASTDLIKSFVKGLKKNKKELAKAAGDIVDAFVDGLTDLLPSGIQKPVKEAMDSIKKSIESGGLKKAADTFCNFVENMGEVVEDVAEHALPVFVEIIDFAGEHLGILTAAVTACVVAYKGFSVINTAVTVLNTAKQGFLAASAAVNAYSLATTASAAGATVQVASLTAGQTAVGLLTGKITLATAAQTAWNLVMSANPIGLVVTAVAALAAGIAVYKLATDDVVTAEEMHQQRMEDLSNRISDQKDRWKELEQAKADQLAADLPMIDRTKELWTEMQGLVDANGKVKEGYEERCAFIAGQLNEATGTEIEIIDGVVQKYDELCASVDAAIEKKRAQIILNASEAEYSEALQNIRQAEMNQAEAKRALDEQQMLVTQAEIEYQQELARIEKEVADNAAMQVSEKERLKAAAWAELEEQKQILAERQTAFSESDAMVKTYYENITDYETLATAIHSGNSEEMKAATASVTASYQTATTANASELATQLLNQQEHLTMLRKAQDEGQKGITADKIANAEAELVAMQAEYDKATANLDAHTAEIAGLMDGMTSDMSDEQAAQLGIWLAMVADAQVNGKAISDETSAMVEEVIGRLDEMPEQTRETMKDAMKPMLQEMQNAEPGLFEKASGIANGILSRLRKAFDINSPSRETRSIFRYVMQGAELGLSDEEQELYDQTQGVADGVLERFQGLDVSELIGMAEEAVGSMGDSFFPDSVKEKAELAVSYRESDGYDPETGMDYRKMADAVKQALNGTTVNIDGREAGEILTPYTDQNLGKEEKWRERQ